MGVLNRLANRGEQLDSALDAQLGTIAKIDDRLAVDELHREERPAGIARAGVVDLGNVRVIEHRQRLAFGFEPRDQRPRVHPGFDDFQRDAPLDRLALPRLENDPETALADFANQLVGPDPVARFLDDGICFLAVFGNKHRRRLEEGVRIVERRQQLLDFGALRLVFAGFFEKLVALRPAGQIERIQKQRLVARGDFDIFSGRTHRLRRLERMKIARQRGKESVLRGEHREER